MKNIKKIVIPICLTLPLIMIMALLNKIAFDSYPPTGIEIMQAISLAIFSVILHSLIYKHKH